MGLDAALGGADLEIGAWIPKLEAFGGMISVWWLHIWQRQRVEPRPRTQATEWCPFLVVSTPDLT